MYICSVKIRQHKKARYVIIRGQNYGNLLLGRRLLQVLQRKGEILSFMFTPADVDDREPLKSMDFVKEIYGKLVGDKGYISRELFQELFVDGIQLITKVRNNMKNCLMSVSDKILIRKRAVIESVIDELKNIAAYCFFPKTPSISLEYCSDNQLTIF